MKLGTFLFVLELIGLLSADPSIVTESRKNCLKLAKFIVNYY